MYELLKKDKWEMTQHNNKKELVYNLEYLFEKLQVEAKSIKSTYQPFKINVMEVVKREINEQTDLYFEYQGLRGGYKIDRIQITTLYNKTDTKIQEEEKSPLNDTKSTEIDYKKLFEEEQRRNQELENKNYSLRSDKNKILDLLEDNYLTEIGEN